MNASGTLDSPGPGRLIAPVVEDSTLLLLLLATGGTMAAMVLAHLAGSQLLSWVRLLALIPLIAAGYGSRGPVLPLILVVFFGSSFLPDVLVTWGTPGFNAAALQLLTYVLFLAVVGYLSGSIAGFLGARTALREAVRKREALLARATNLDQVIAFLLEEAIADIDVEQAALLMQHPLEGHWQVATLEGGQLLYQPLTSEGEGLQLANWLVDRGVMQVFFDMATDPRFVDAQAGTALLAQPLREPGGAMLAMLVLVDRRGRWFRSEALELAASLAAAAAQAMIQAGVKARVDQDLARQIGRLAAIQRAARDLNASLDQRRIAKRILSAVVDVAEADAGLVVVDTQNRTPIVESLNAEAGDETVHQLAEVAERLSRGKVNLDGLESIPSLLPRPAVRLLVPIRRQQQMLGFVIVESDREGAFGPDAQAALTGVADQAAVALENAWLFGEITREKQVSEQILTSIADALLTVDGQGLVTGFNPAAERLTGKRQEEVTGRLVCDVLGCARAGACASDCRLMAAVEGSQGVSDDRWVIGQQPGGRQRVVTMSAAPLPAGNGSRGELVVLLHDITERYEGEQFQRNLVAALSHELRTPLTSITAIADILLATGDQPSQETQAHLHLLKAEARRLADFAGKMLDVARNKGDQKRLEARPVPVNYFVRSQVPRWTDGLVGRALQVGLPPERLWVWADEQALETILSTLLDNAHKYSPPGLPIALDITAAPPGQVTFAVKDHGPGIAAEHQARVFDRFYRIEAGDSQAVYGQGLGLYLARNLVEAMAGRIWLESRGGGGSRFCFTVPQVEEEALEEDPGH